MKYLVMSDIHGVMDYALKIDDIINYEKPDKIILLGDLYYHGVSNNYMNVVDILNKYSDIILCTRGNCDNDVDESVSNFKFNDYIKLTINNKKYFFTHGHLYTINSIDDIDVFIYGHLHTGFIKKEKNIICVNTGSISLPRNNTKHSYVVIDNDTIILKDINYNIIDSIKNE